MNPYNVFNKRVLIFLIVLVTLITIFIIFFDKGTLKIVAKPTEVNVTVKNKIYSTPLTIKLRQGSYKISASKDGFMDQETTIQIKPFKTTELYFNMISNTVIEPTHFKVPDAVNLLPVVTDHFRIDWISDMNTLVIVPNIAYGNENPKTFLKDNWTTYNQYGQEALKWLADHGIGKSIREEDSIEIEWWLQEFWPPGASISS